MTRRERASLRTNACRQAVLEAVRQHPMSTAPELADILWEQIGTGLNVSHYLYWWEKRGRVIRHPEPPLPGRTRAAAVRWKTTGHERLVEGDPVEILRGKEFR